ncbi:MAG: hypothetical protein ABFE01_15165 [Phycisphaerales bacterium]|jgi:hypothetical protein
MSGVENVGSANLTHYASNAATAAQGQSTTNPDWKRHGMEQALALSERYLAQALNEAGFVGVGAGASAGLSAQNDPESQVGMSPLTASQVAAYMGTQLATDAEQALRTTAEVDTASVAALLR